MGEACITSVMDFENISVNIVRTVVQGDCRKVAHFVLLLSICVRIVDIKVVSCFWLG